MVRTPVYGGDIAAPLSVGSLFSGAGMLDLGLERAGWATAWHSEIDPYATTILKRHWPHTPNLGDVRGVDRDLRETPVELLAGGFPCQDLSSAGKRAGLEGARSGLWFEYARIIDTLRPRFVLIENVARLRSAGLDTVLGDLAARGYDAEWDVVGAAAIGAPHLRERIWIVAWHAARVRLPDPSGLGVRVERERVGEQRGEPGAPVAGGDGASRGLAGLADGDERGREVERAPHDHHGRHALRDVADGRRPDVAYAEWRGRVFDRAALAEWADRCRRETWPRHTIVAADEAGAEPRLGGAADGAARRLDVRPVQAWECATPRSLTGEEAAERRLRGEVRSARLTAIGNGVVPQIAEFLGLRIRAMRAFSERR